MYSLNDLNQKEIKQILFYNPKTGIFKWKINHKKRKRGDVAGSKTTSGYIRITHKQKEYRAHHLAFLYMKGYFPENQIDHINRIRDDNRWINLIEATHQCNMQNCKVQKNNRTGITGVSYIKKHNTYSSHIWYDNRNHELGRSKTKEDAALLRWNAEKKYKFSNCNSTSSAYLYLKEKGII